jgi:hypothetical protein
MLWMSCACVFLFGEIIFRRSWFIWLGFGSALTGILALLDINVPGQISVFINISGILIVVERRFFERYTFKKPVTKENISDNATKLPFSDDSSNIFRPLGIGWEIKYQGIFYTVKPSVGLIHIKNLIMNQGKWLHCSELKRISMENSATDKKFKPYTTMSNNQFNDEGLHNTEEIFNEKIISRLSLKKILSLRDKITEHIEYNEMIDPEDLMNQKRKRDFLDKYLNSITDKKGKIRTLYNQSEKDRKAVSAAINRCRNSLSEHKDLYIHFTSFISAKDSAFRYLPDRPIQWKTD